MTELVSSQSGAEATSRLRRAVSALLLVVVTGTAGFMFVEGWSPWHAFYFTLVTITTVGYGDDGISEAGRVWAAILLVGGIGTASYAVSYGVQAALAKQLAWRERMQKQVDAVSGHTIVCGLGRMGRTVCERLHAESSPFVLVDESEHKIDEARELGYLCVEGTATDDAILHRAGIERAACVVSAVNTEAGNIVVSLSARELNPDVSIIARAESEEEERKLKRAGADHIVSPFHSGGIEVANRIVKPHLADLLARSVDSRVCLGMAEIRIVEGHRLAGVSLADYGRSDGASLSFVALDRATGETLVPPAGNATLNVGDLLTVAGRAEDIASLKADPVERRAA